MDYNQQAEDIFSENDLEKLLDLSNSVDLRHIDGEKSAQYLDELAHIVALNDSESSAENNEFSDDQTTDLHTGIGCGKQKWQSNSLKKNLQQPGQPSSSEQEKIHNTISHDITLSGSTTYFQSIPSTSTAFQENNSPTEKKSVPAISFDQNQLVVLELEFQKCPYPDDYARSKLALILDTNKDKVKKWFEQRRMKQKKLEYQRADKKEQEQCLQVPSQSIQRFTESQLAVLEEEFNECQYPDLYTYGNIASKVNLTEKRVRYWFQKRRSKQVQNQEIKGRSAPLNGTQLEELNDVFVKCQNPDFAKLLELASKLNLPVTRIRTWFTKRRYALKRCKNWHSVETTTKANS